MEGLSTLIAYGIIWAPVVFVVALLISLGRYAWRAFRISRESIVPYEDFSKDLMLDFFITCKENKLLDPYQEVADKYGMSRIEAKTKVLMLIYGGDLNDR